MNSGVECPSPTSTPQWGCCGHAWSINTGRTPGSRSPSPSYNVLDADADADALAAIVTCLDRSRPGTPAQRARDVMDPKKENNSGKYGPLWNQLAPNLKAQELTRPPNHCEAAVEGKPHVKGRALVA